ncbi:MAG: molybdopterin-dependent oxidoreductase [Campylobacterales bacterium]
MPHSQTRLIDSVCTYCGVGCDILAHVDDQGIKKITARTDGVVSQGKLCIKGKEGYSYLDSPNRLRSHRVRRAFLEQVRDEMPPELAASFPNEGEGEWLEVDLERVAKLIAWRFGFIKQKYGSDAIAGIGGARTNCESGFTFQKFIRSTIGSPHIDNCARVCHSPSLAGMRATIGEGASTNPFDDIYQTDFILVIGSNTTEGHPIVANRMLDRVRQGARLAVVDVREIQLSKKAHWHLSLPYEANLLFLNMMARVILEERLYNEEFILLHTEGFAAYQEAILADEMTKPELFLQMDGYEDLAWKVREVARYYAKHRSMIFWGLGITEHLDGSYAVMAMANLALMTGNIGKRGAGLMPLRGQNNVQGACDVGCLPYYGPDYSVPEREGLKTPDLIDAMLEDRLKGLWVVGEDLAHIHANINKIERALGHLDFLVVNELFETEIAKAADVIIAVRSAYEKEGVYVNAERRMHLAAPLIPSDLPDDWEVIARVAQLMGDDYGYTKTEEVWDDLRRVVSRYQGASYAKLKERKSAGLQWPVADDDLPVLHIGRFRTENGLGRFCYHGYQPRGMVDELLRGGERSFYLTTGRVIVHYNNAAQTRQSERLLKNYPRDLLLLNPDDAKHFNPELPIILTSEYGQSAPLAWKSSPTIKRGTLFSSFHFYESRINTLFGDESDVITKTARFKSLAVALHQPK